MTAEQNHPITPPPELVQQWSNVTAYDQPVIDNWVTIATQAARWGANQELDACINEIYKGVGLRHVDYSSNRESLCSDLRAARRPKPLSLKQQALSELDSLESMGACNADTIRRALEQLND